MGAFVAVVGPNGEAGTVPEEKLDEALKAGFRRESDAETRARAIDQEQGDRPLMTFAEHAFNTATLGGAEGMLDAAGREEYEQRTARNRLAAIGGDVAGSFLPMAPGAGAAGSLGSAASAVGHAVEALPGVARLAEGGLAARAAAKALPAAAEGAVFGLAGAATTPNDDPMTAEALVSHFGSHALYGALAGGALGAGGSLLGDAARAGQAAARRWADKLAGEGKIGDELLAVVKRQPLSGELRTAAESELGALKESAFKEENAILGERKAAQQWRDDLRTATGNFKDELEHVDSVSRQTAKWARKEIEKAGESASAEARDALAAYDAARNRAQEFFPTSAVEQAGARKKLFTIDMPDAEIVRTIQNDAARAALNAQKEATVNLIRVLKPDTAVKDAGIFASHGEQLAGLAGQAPAMEERLATIAAPLNSEKLQIIKLQMGKLERSLADGADKAALAKDIVTAAEKHGLKVSPEDIAAYAQRHSLDVERVAAGGPLETAIKADLYRDAIRARASAAGGGGAIAGAAAKYGGAAGAAAGMYVGGPAGAFIGHHLGKLAGKSLSGFAGKFSANRDVIAKAIADGVDSFVGTAGKAADAAAPAAIPSALSALENARFGRAAVDSAPASTYKARAAEIASSVGPDGQVTPETRMQIHNRLAGVRAVDMKLGDQVESLAVKAIEYLSAKMPRDMNPPNLTGAPSKYQPSDSQLHSWARTAAAVADPTRLISELQSGRLTVETVEAVKEIYPSVFAKVQERILDRLTDLRAELPRSKRLTLSILFDAPVDPLMEPSMIAMFQGAYAAPENQPKKLSKNDIGSVKTTPEPTPGQRMAG